MRHPKRRIVAPVLVAGTALLLAACGSNNNGQNSLNPHGSAASKIDDLFIPILTLAIVIGDPGAGRHRLRRDQVPPPRGQAGQPEAGPREHAARDRLDDRPGAHPRRRRRSRPSRRSGTSPTARRAPRCSRSHVTGKQWWWQFQLPEQPLVPQSKTYSYPTAQSSPTGPVDGAKGQVTTSTELHIPVGTKVDLFAPRTRRHPLVLGAGAVRQEGRHAGAHQPPHHRGRQAGHLSRRVCRVLRAVARRHALPGHRRADGPVEGVAGRHQRPADRATTGPRRADRVYTLTNKTYGCTGCHVFDDALSTELRPEPHAPREPHHVRGRHAEAEPHEPHRVDHERAGQVAMESKDCRLPPPADVHAACRRSRRTRRRARRR